MRGSEVQKKRFYGCAVTIEKELISKANVEEKYPFVRLHFSLEYKGHNLSFQAWTIDSPEKNRIKEGLVKKSISYHLRRIDQEEAFNEKDTIDGCVSNCIN